MRLLSKSLNLFGCQGDNKGKFKKKMFKKSFFSETMRWMNLILFLHVHDIILYINSGFCFVQVRTGCNLFSFLWLYLATSLISFTFFYFCLFILILLVHVCLSDFA